MDRDNEIELIQTIQEKDKRIKELETINENITRELLSRTEKLSEVLEKLKDRVSKDKIRELLEKLNLKLDKLKQEMDKEYDTYGKSSFYLDLDEQWDYLYEIKELLEEE